MNPTDPNQAGGIPADPNQGGIGGDQGQVPAVDPNAGQPTGAPVADPNAGQALPEAPVTETPAPETPVTETPAPEGGAPVV